MAGLSGRGGAPRGAGVAARGRRPLRSWLVALGTLAVATLVWVLVPMPFVRGLLVGGLVGPAALLIALTAVARRFRRRMRDRLEPPPLPATRWDFAMEAESLDGERVDFADFSGRVLVLSFWATWCAPCVAEMPGLARLAEATSDLGVKLACVSREPLSTVRDFARIRGLDAPVYALVGEVPACFESRAVPATFVIDKRGAIVLRHHGAAAWDDADVVAFVRGLALAPET